MSMAFAKLKIGSFRKLFLNCSELIPLVNIPFVNEVNG